LKRFAAGLLAALLFPFGATPASAQSAPERYEGRCVATPRLERYLFLMGYQGAGNINCTRVEIDWDHRIRFESDHMPMAFVFEGHRGDKSGEFVIERMQSFLGEPQAVKGRCAFSAEDDGRMLTCFAEYQLAGGKHATAFSFAVAEKDRPGEARAAAGSCGKSAEWEATLQSLLEYEATAPVPAVEADTIACIRATIEPGKRYVFANGEDAEDQLVLTAARDEDNLVKITAISFGGGPAQAVKAGMCADLRRRDGSLVTACAVAWRAGARDRRLVIEFTPTPSR
jgi:hypothetical protein